MRMWMVDPTKMCRKHLLGEHVEIHMAVGSLRNGKSLQGYLDRGLLEPQHFYRRHTALVKEMKRRGYKHKSPLRVTGLKPPHGRVNVPHSLKELRARCPECRRR